MRHLHAWTFVGLIAITGCAATTPEQRKIDTELGRKQAPDFELKALDGQNVRLSDYRGKPVLLTFWGFGCPPCRAEAPHISQLAEKYKDAGLVVLAVNAWDEDKDVITQFVNDYKLRQRVLLNGKETFKGPYGQKSIPVTLWLDRSGRIVRTHIDFSETDVPLMDDYTAKLVASKS